MLCVVIFNISCDEFYEQAKSICSTSLNTWSVSCFLCAPPGMGKAVSLLVMHKAPDTSPLSVGCFSNQPFCRPVPSRRVENRRSHVAFGGVLQSPEGLGVRRLLP